VITTTRAAGKGKKQSGIQGAKFSRKSRDHAGETLNHLRRVTVERWPAHRNGVRRRTAGISEIASGVFEASTRQSASMVFIVRSIKTTDSLCDREWSRPSRTGCFVSGNGNHGDRRRQTNPRAAKAKPTLITWTETLVESSHGQAWPRSQDGFGRQQPLCN